MTTPTPDIREFPQGVFSAIAVPSLDDLGGDEGFKPYAGTLWFAPTTINDPQDRLSLNTKHEMLAGRVALGYFPRNIPRDEYIPKRIKLATEEEWGTLCSFVVAGIARRIDL